MSVGTYLIVIGIIGIFLGALGIWKPELMWIIGPGKWCEGGEPSDSCCTMARISGVVCIGIAIFAICMGLFRV